VPYTHVPHVIPAHFFCASAYPDGHPDQLLDEDKELDNLKAKVDAGADFIVTQLFYDVDGFLSWLRKVRQKGVSRSIFTFAPASSVFQVSTCLSYLE
jgi:5,10-methylenetetrahydrofolate reductase